MSGIIGQFLGSEPLFQWATGIFSFYEGVHNGPQGDRGNRWTRIQINYTLNGMPTSNYETRVKSKFFSLMIYAGYPIA